MNRIQASRLLALAGSKVIYSSNQPISEQRMTASPGFEHDVALLCSLSADTLKEMEAYFSHSPVDVDERT